MSLRDRLLLLVFGLFSAMTILLMVAASWFDFVEARRGSVLRANAIVETAALAVLPHLERQDYDAVVDAASFLLPAELSEKLEIHDFARKIKINVPSRFATAVPLPPPAGERPGKFEPLPKTAPLPSLLIAEEQTGPRLKVQQPIINPETGQSIGTVGLTTLQPRIAAVFEEIVLRNLAVATALLVLAIIIARRLATSFISPITELTHAVEKTGTGNFSVHLPVDRRDEVGILTRAYTEMLAKLRANFNKIQNLAFQDPVTNLSNRALFRKLLEWQIRDEPNVPVCVFLIDIDNFKHVNDTFGHDHGDHLLRIIAHRLHDVIVKLGLGEIYDGKLDSVSAHLIGGGCNVSRFGGDEFAIFFTAHARTPDPDHVAQNVLAQMNQPVIVGNVRHMLAASIGAAAFPRDARDYSALIRRADLALNAAKKAGGNRLCLYTQEFEQVAVNRMNGENSIRRALDRGEFGIRFQPQIECRTGIISSVEVLTRHFHPELGMMPPSTFIPIAEESNLICRLGDLVLEKSCAQARQWLDAGTPLRVSVNISARQLEGSGLAEKVIRILEYHKLPPEYLELELTETIAMTNPEMVYNNTSPLRKIGVKFALDDFGKGYSSLSQLSQLPFDIFKIDSSFIDNMDRDQTAQTIVETIIAMARAMNYETIAEGVERRAQYDRLVELGCDKIQGYLVSGPVTAQEVIALKDGALKDGALKDGALKDGQTFAAGHGAEATQAAGGRAPTGLRAASGAANGTPPVPGPGALTRHPAIPPATRSVIPGTV